MESLPLQLISFINQLRPLMRREVFDTFVLLLTGILIGEARHGTVQAGRPAPQFADSNRTYVVDNYKYVYTLSKNPNECGVFAAPLGPRREEANTLFVLVTAQGAARTWKGAALPDKDIEMLAQLGIPTENQLSYLGLVEQKEQPKPAK
jgi:hypothetical protein